MSGGVGAAPGGTRVSHAAGAEPRPPCRPLGRWRTLSSPAAVPLPQVTRSAPRLSVLYSPTSSLLPRPSLSCAQRLPACYCPAPDAVPLDPGTYPALVRFLYDAGASLDRVTSYSSPMHLALQSVLAPPQLPRARAACAFRPDARCPTAAVRPRRSCPALPCRLLCRRRSTVVPPARLFASGSYLPQPVSRRGRAPTPHASLAGYPRHHLCSLPTPRVVQRCSRPPSPRLHLRFLSHSAQLAAQCLSIPPPPGCHSRSAPLLVPPAFLRPVV